jgi:hypothetical protein
VTVPEGVISFALAGGFDALISWHDYEMLMALGPWRVQKHKHTLYAKADMWKTREDGTRFRSTCYMHRVITDAHPSCHVDHRDHDGLHNWRENLRVTIPGMNQLNRRVAGSLPFKGVDMTGGRYRARITDLTGTTPARLHLGYFDTPEEAACAYDAKCVALYGAFFDLNFPAEAHGQLANHTLPPPQEVPF